MKQKYELIRLAETKQLKIREYAELDKEVHTLLCERTYDLATITEAMERGREALSAAFRNRHLYPNRFHAEKIADALAALMRDTDHESVEIFIDDAEYLSGTDEHRDFLPAIEEEEAEDLDELVEEEFDEDVDEDFEDKIEIKKVSSPLQIADDDIPEMEDDN